MTAYLAPVFVRNDNHFIVPQVWISTGSNGDWSALEVLELSAIADSIIRRLHCVYSEWRRFEADENGESDLTYFVAQLKISPTAEPFTVFLFSGPQFDKFTALEAEQHGHE